jgi:hypothetical protein
MRIAATESVSLCTPTKSAVRLLNSNLRFARLNAQRIAERVKQSSTTCRGSSKNFLDYVIRRFNLPSARLNKPQGLDLR